MAAVALPMRVEPLGQKVRINHRLLAVRVLLLASPLWRVLAVGASSVVVVEEAAAVVAVLEAPGLLGGLVSMRVPLVDSLPVVEERRCEKRSHRRGLGASLELHNKW